MKTMYVSAPIFGVAEPRKLFEEGEALASNLGYRAVIPLDVEVEPHEGPCPPGRQARLAAHTDPCHMRADIKAMLDCQGALFMAGWMASWGCRTEMGIAALCGLPIRVQDPHGRIIRL